MAYNKEFFDAYQAYLWEPTVRRSHGFAFSTFVAMAGKQFVMDLGCGLGEFKQFGTYSDYCGIDSFDSGFVKPFIQADYKDSTFSAAVRHQLGFAPTAFVSLFSAELIIPSDQRQLFYESLFRSFPTLYYGLVAGFYYESKIEQEKVEEAGGVVSFQTFPAGTFSMSPIYDEHQLVIRTPSKMFGTDVVEVWKILTCRG